MYMRHGAAFVLLAAMTAAPGCPGGGGSGASAPRPLPPAPYAVRASQQTIPTSNGFAAASYDLASHQIDTFRDHIYARTSATEAAKDFCHDLYFGWRKGGMSQWLPSVLETSAGYVEGTGIVRVVQRASGLRFETYWFAPMT